MQLDLFPLTTLLIAAFQGFLAESTLSTVEGLEMTWLESLNIMSFRA